MPTELPGPDVLTLASVSLFGLIQSWELPLLRSSFITTVVSVLVGMAFVLMTKSALVTVPPTAVKPSKAVPEGAPLVKAKTRQRNPLVWSGPVVELYQKWTKKLPLTLLVSTAMAAKFTIMLA